MHLINTKALGVTLGEELFSDLNITISKADRIGLVAANGRGKSTLLACLARELEPTRGDITWARGLRVGHVRQEIPELALQQTLHELALGALPPDQADFESWRVDVVLEELQVPYPVQHSKLAQLSGGWRRTAMLAAVWVTDPDVMLLDEPTNHLDLQRIGMLESWLRGLSRDVPLVITSHDRAFLDATTNRTLFLRRDRSQMFGLPYAQARTALEEADASDERAFKNQLNKAKQLRKQAAKLKNIGINSSSDLLVVKTKQLTERAEKVEAAAKPAYTERGAGDIKLANSGTHAKALVTLEDLDVCTSEGRLLYRTGRKWIVRGDRIVLLGSNGSGKTRLVSLIAAALEGAETGVRCAPAVSPAYSDQHLSQLNPRQTPMRAITAAFDIGDQRARTLLAGAGIDIRLQETPIDALSGGQKARLAMLILRLKKPNFCLLDEPTNHLDIEGQEALESELIGREVSCLLVSHDRHFLKTVGNRFWLIDRKRLVELDGPDAFLAGELNQGA